jgi:hypothetical protein
MRSESTRVLVNYSQHDGQTYLITEKNSSGTEFLSAEIMEPVKKKLKQSPWSNT